MFFPPKMKFLFLYQRFCYSVQYQPHNSVRTWDPFPLSVHLLRLWVPFQHLCFTGFLLVLLQQTKSVFLSHVAPLLRVCSIFLARIFFNTSLHDAFVVLASQKLSSIVLEGSLGLFFFGDMLRHLRSPKGFAISFRYKLFLLSAVTVCFVPFIATVLFCSNLHSKGIYSFYFSKSKNVSWIH